MSLPVTYLCNNTNNPTTRLKVCQFKSYEHHRVPELIQTQQRRPRIHGCTPAPEHRLCELKPLPGGIATLYPKSLRVLEAWKHAPTT